MPVTTVPRFEDPAFSVDAVDPSTEPIWGTAPLLNWDSPDGSLFAFNNANEFVFANPGGTLEQLIVKSLITDRLMFNAYDKEFGSDFWTIIGRGLSDLAVRTAAEKFTREALSNIDLIRAIDQYNSAVSGETLYISFRVVTISGQAQQFSFSRTIA